MNILTSIILAVAGITALLLIAALFMKRGYSTYREIAIGVPAEIAFAYLRHIRNQDHFNKWIMVDPEMKKEFRGIDGTVGFVYAWEGNKEAGEGEQEIKAIDEGKNIAMEIRFVRPFSGIAQAEFRTAPQSDNQTKVSWNTASTMKYPLNIMQPIIVKMLERDMGTSLLTLKAILENSHKEIGKPV